MVRKICGGEPTPSFSSSRLTPRLMSSWKWYASRCSLRTRSRKRSKMAWRLSSAGTSLEAPNTEISGTSTTVEPLLNLRSLSRVSSALRMALLDLKISSRKTISASGIMPSVRRR